MTKLNIYLRWGGRYELWGARTRCRLSWSGPPTQPQDLRVDSPSRFQGSATPGPQEDDARKSVNRSDSSDKPPDPYSFLPWLCSLQSRWRWPGRCEDTSRCPTRGPCVRTLLDSTCLCGRSAGQTDTLSAWKWAAFSDIRWGRIKGSSGGGITGVMRWIIQLSIRCCYNGAGVKHWLSVQISACGVGRRVSDTEGHTVELSKNRRTGRLHKCLQHDKAALYDLWVMYWTISGLLKSA